MNSTRKYLVTQLEKTGSITEFELAEALLVMYDSGIINAIEKEDSEPLFLLNEEATDTQHAWADKFHEHLHNAPNDVWNNYVYKVEN